MSNWTEQTELAMSSTVSRKSNSAKKWVNSLFTFVYLQYTKYTHTHTHIGMHDAANFHQSYLSSPIYIPIHNKWLTATLNHECALSA